MPQARRYEMPPATVPPPLPGVLGAAPLGVQVPIWEGVESSRAVRQSENQAVRQRNGYVMQTWVGSSTEQQIPGRQLNAAQLTSQSRETCDTPTDSSSLGLRGRTSGGAAACCCS